MSGVEAFLGLSLLSSTISIVDEIKKVYDSAKDAGGFPKAFREVAAQLPLVAETLYSLRHYVQEGNISEDSYNEITLVVKDCEAKAKELYDLFMKVTPRGNASASDRYSLTVRALGKGNLAMNLIQGMLKDIQFLAQAANVNSLDGYGQTALHLAAEKGALTVVENLIRRGADINVRDKYGRTALHLAARDGASNVVELLLSQGADATIATLEGETARDLADKKNITKLFDDPPIVDGETSTTEDAQRKQVRPVPPKNKDREDICRKMSASVRYFSGRKKKEYTVPVFDLIYEGDRLSADEAKQLLVSKADMKKEITAAEHDKLPDRWIHLPANNVNWIYDLLECLCSMDGKDQGYCKTLKEFVKSTFHERYGDQGHRVSYSRQPLFLRSDPLYRVSLAMPYFDMESTEAYDSSKTEAGRDNYALERAYPKPSELHVTQTLNRSYHLSLQDTKRRDNDQVVLSYTTQRRNNWKALQAEGKQKKPEDYQAQDNDQDETKIPIPSHDIDFTQHQENPFHTQQPGVQDVSQDDISPVDIQVPAAIRINTVNRRNSQHELGGGITPTEQPSQKQVAADKGPGVAMLMVHQLWLWKIDERTIITAFSNRQHRGDDSVNWTLQASLTRAFNNSHELSADHMIARIILRCISFLDIPAKAGLEEPAFDIFAVSIADLSENVMNLHEDFFKSLKNEKTSLQDEKRLSAFSIENDTECLRKVKRIRNEIMMINNVLHAQRGVFETASGIAEKEMKTWKTTKSGTHHPWEDLVDARTIYTFCDRIKRLDDDAQRVEDSLNHLLDLKQKQVNITQTIKMKEIAIDTANQGRFIFVFTVVTVVFAPLAFMATLFALPIPDQFPQSQNGTNEFSTGYISKWMATGELATLTLILLGILFFSREFLFTRWKACFSKLSSPHSPAATKQEGNVNEESTNPSKVIDTTSAESKNSTVREKAPAHSVIDLAKLDESNNQGENPDSSSHLIEEDTGTIWNRLRLRPRINRIQDSSRKDLESAK